MSAGRGLRGRSVLPLAFVALVSILAAPAEASVTSLKQDRDSVTFALDKGSLKVRICNPVIVEIRYTTLPSFPPKTSLIINNEWKSIPKFTVAQTKDQIVITTASLRIKVARASNAITFADSKDSVILAEDGAEGKTMTPTTIAGLGVNRCTTQFLSPSDEALFGLGCHPEDTNSINYKGRNQDLVIKYMTGAIPVLLSTSGYGLLWDNYSPSYFYGAEAGNTKFKYVSENGSMVDYYFFYGPDFDHIIGSYREATGAAPMFPKWAFGLFQSQDRYQSQREVLSVKDRYRQEGLPLDCIVQDWFYWEPDVIGSHVFGRERYPDPKAMVDELHKANLHAMISIWPVFAKGTANYGQLAKAGNLTSITWNNVMTHTMDSYYDAHSAPARQMYWQQARDNLVAPQGWDAWWVDQCEPDNGSLLDDRRRCTFDIGPGIDYFNTYSLMHTTGLYDNWRKDLPAKRAFFLTRQAFAGQQRNATTLWSSDITCTWSAYKSQVPQGINACASGIPFWTSDIGGYHLGWTAPDWSTAANRELFTRWFQFGTFCPIFRIHGKGERALFSDNWDANTKVVLLKYDNLRYRLLPYIYSLGWKITSDGDTMMRSLAFDFRTDTNINSIPDQYLFGPAFMVSPVTEPLQSLHACASGQKARKIYLPSPAAWFDFWTGQTYAGGQTIDAPAPIETLPLCVKAGSIVPMGPFLQYASEKPADPIELRIYPGANADFNLYEDENDTYNYEHGAYSTIPFHWDDTKHCLTIGATQGHFPGMLKEREFAVVIVSPSHGVGLSVTDQPDKVVIFRGKDQTIQF
jgi:alpha-D-xyloside xylohydrolase